MKERSPKNSQLLPVAAVCGLNSYALGRPMGIATQGGINFYIGNNPEASGYSAILPEPWGYAWNYRDLVRHAELDTGHPLDDAQVSDYYYDQGWHFIRSEPGEPLAKLRHQVIYHQVIYKVARVD